MIPPQRPTGSPTNSPGGGAWSVLRLLPILALLLISSPARAALDADVVLIYGSSWKRVLPTYAAAAKAPAKDSEAAAALPPVILWEGGEERWTEDLLRRLAPKKVIVVGPAGVSSSTLQIPGEVSRIEATDERIGAELARLAFPKGSQAPAVFVADGTAFAPALAASALAASSRAPLLVASGDLPATVREAGALARELGAEEVVVIGSGDETLLSAAAGRRVRVIDGAAALGAYNRKVASTRHLVVTAPSDVDGPFSPPKLSMGSLPYILGKGAAVAWVGLGPGEGRNPEAAAVLLEADDMGPFEAVSIVGDHLAIPMHHMEDIDQVAAGKADPRVHKVPSFVTQSGRAADRAVGRLAALDVFDLSRWVTRIVHGVREPGDGRGALILANADHKFVLGEAISRTTSAELANAGVKVESYYRDEITPELIRQELPGHGLILWEGHPRDLTLDDDALPAPETSLPPASYFLQGCYTLDRSDPYLLIERGANAVIGTYMAVYSASGSGFARAYLSGQLHRQETAGEAMSSARNFLLATVELKKRRGHKDWRKTLRAALSFDLWGDPTAAIPVKTGATKKAPVQAKVAGNQITVRIPAARLPRTTAGAYVAEIRPGAQLSALYDHDDERKERRLVELFFVEVDLPASLGDNPQLTGPSDPSTYAWVWSPRSRKLSLLVHQDAIPKSVGKGAATLRFTASRGEAD